MSQFYIQTDATWPRAYHLVPVEQAPARGYRYAVAPAFVVHSKDGGSYKKAQPFVVRGVGRDELLVQKIGDYCEPDCHADYRKLHADGTWHTLRFDNTVEGYRFVRTVRKVVELLAKLAREGQKDRAKVAKAAKDFEDRGARCGICPCCFGDYVADKSTGAKMVHHGYERPGDGMIHGDCYGVGYVPFEVSCEGTKFYRGIIQNSLRMRQETLAALPTLETVKVEAGSKFRAGRFWPEYREIKRGEHGFDAEIASRRRQLERQIEITTEHLTDLTRKIDNWKPATFPRKAAAS